MLYWLCGAGLCHHGWLDRTCEASLHSWCSWRWTLYFQFSPFGPLKYNISITVIIKKFEKSLYSSIYLYVYIVIYVYVCVYLCTCVCIYVAMYVCPCIYKYVFVCRYVYFYRCKVFMNTIRGSPDNAFIRGNLRFPGY